MTCGAAARRRAGLGLAHAAERQRAERGERAGREARAAQECAAIEAAARLFGERRGERRRGVPGVRFS